MALEPRVGWVGIDARTVARIRKAMEQRDEGIVDELGLGALHLGYADRFFPGTSVLHTRARYAFFVPWVFLTLAERRVRRDRLTEGKRRLERALTGALKTAMASGGERDTRGIIGVRIYPRSPAQPPDFAWWTALGMWGLYDGPSRGSLAARWDPRRVVRAAAEGAPGEEDVSEEPLARFNVPKVPGGWPEDVAQQGFDLTRDEAEWLRARWEQLPEASLLASIAALLKHNRKPLREGALWDDPLVREAAQTADGDPRRRPLDFRRAVENAQHASAVAELARATYAAWIEEAAIADAGGRRGERLERLDYVASLDAYWKDRAWVREAAMSLDLDVLQRDLPELATVRGRPLALLAATLATWRRATRSGDVLGDRALRATFEKAEWERKHSRARLPKVEGRTRRADFTATTVGVTGLDYRWSVTRRLVTDVAQGLRR